MAVELIGNPSGVKADVHGASKGLQSMLVDAAGNPLIRNDKAALPATPAGAPIMGVDGGVSRLIRCDPQGNLQTGDEALLFEDPIEASAFNSMLWAQSLTGMTVTVANCNVLMNAASSVTLGNFALSTSIRQFPTLPRSSLIFRTRARVVHFTNAVVEFGFGAPAGATATINNGAFFRRKTDGTLVGILASNGTETATANLSLPNSTDYYIYEVVLSNDRAQFMIWNASSGAPIADAVVFSPLTSISVLAVTHTPCFHRIYNNTAPGTAAQLFYSSATVVAGDLKLNKPWNHKLAGMAKGMVTSPTTFLQLANYANSAAPTVSGALSNTAAAFTTLGGKFLLPVNVAGAETDYIVFGWQNPAPYSAYITYLEFDAITLGAVVATTAHVLEWGIGVNASAVSLATAAPNDAKRVALPGRMIAAVAAAVNTPYSGGNVGGGVTRYVPQTPLVVEPGRFFHLILRIVVGTATAAQQIRGSCLVDGYFE